MKKLLLILPFLLLGSMSCSKTQVNEVKLTLAQKAGNSVEKLLNKKFEQSQDGLDNEYCRAESKGFGDKLEEKVQDLLKAESGGQKSFAGDALKLACKGILKTAVPFVLESRLDAYPCIAKVVGGESKVLAEKVCEDIKYP